MGDGEEMSPETLAAIRARLDEPPPLLALVERHRGQTALAEYLSRLASDRIALVDEVDRLRAELTIAQGEGETTPGEPASQ